MEVNNYLSKFTLLLENLLDGNVFINEIDAENILKYLDDHNDNSLGKQILDEPAFIDLILHSLGKIHNTNISAKVFLVKIVTILFKNELQYTKMQLQGFEKLFCITCFLVDSDRAHAHVPSELHLACIELATMVITHRSGLSVIIQNKVWLSVFHPQIHHKSKQISKAAYNFIAKLVWKLNEYHAESELQAVMEYIINPILSSEYLSVLVIDTEIDSELFNKIIPHLNALLAVMTKADNHAPINKVMSLLQDHFRVVESLNEIFDATKNQDLLKLLNSCLIRYHCQIHRHLLYQNKIDDFCTNVVRAHRNYILKAVKKRETLVIVDFAIQHKIFWTQFEKAMTSHVNFPLWYKKDGKYFEFSMQTTVHTLVPLIMYNKLYRAQNQLAVTESIHQFVLKISKTVPDCVYMCCYLFGMILEEGCSSFRKKLITHTLKELHRLIRYLNETQAGILFQLLCYLLQTFILCDETGDGGLVVIEKVTDLDDLRLLTHILNAMKMMLNEHNIPWYENLEIVNIQADLLNLLKQTFLTTKLIVQVLDLINICVKGFLSPNMSLLVEDTQGSTLSEIGHVIKLYIQHEDWEVRDSALILLKTCTEISYIKYIPLQKVIRENNLILLAAKVALTDKEFYSQCTALQCLTAATRNELVWQEVLTDNPNIYMQLFQILKKHGEGMVRKATANVLIGVYLNQKLSSSCLNILYEVMMSAALDDLHWEVQLVALNFWKDAIQKQLTYRGMINGKFPSVIFSKEKRKIITFNNTETQKQLTAIMEHLSNIGCLTVLIKSLNEINDIAVMRLAYRIAKELIEMLEKHNYEMILEVGETQYSEEPTYPMEEDDFILTTLICETNETRRNEIIDSILNLHQSELITRLHDNNDDRTSNEMDLDVTHSSNSKRQLVTPNEFLTIFIQNNYCNVRIEKNNSVNTNCSRTLDELLNDILGV